MKKIFCLFSVLLIFITCTSSHKSAVTPPVNTYKKDIVVLHPKFLIYNISDSISELHFKISSKELLYARPDGINFYSNVLISFRLFQNYDSKIILDSSSVRIVDTNNEGIDKFLIGKINVSALKGKKYILRVSVSDLNKNISSNSVLIIDKENDLNRQNFIVKSKDNNVPTFCNYIQSMEEVSIKFKAKISVALYVRYYNRDFPLAAPPFSSSDSKPFQYKADSAFVLQLSNNGNVNFSARRKGFYHFQLDTTKREGLTLYNFSDNFPKIKKVEDMIPSLRFITSKDEYNELITSTNKKSSVEKFWITCTGNQEKAKDVIKKYYNRMEDANQYFTSYVEGWKTDRGMIYLIFGNPNIIYRDANSETWIYGEENNINSLQYSFTKVNNPFSDNDFLLERSLSFKQSWYNAVDAWRKGKPYSQD